MKNTQSSTFLGIFFAASCIVIWGITFVSTKYLLLDFTPAEILVIRYLLAYIALWILRPRFLKPMNLKTELLFLGAGLTGVTFYQFLENLAISYTAASNVSIIVSICPMTTAILSQFVLKEKHLNIYFNLGFIAAIIGIALVSFNGTVILHLSPKGDLLALGASISWSFYSLFISKINKLEIDPILCTRRNFFWALIFMISLILLDPNASTSLARFTNIWNWTNFLFLGIGASAYCFVAWNVACKTLGTVRTSIGIYFIPVVTIIFAFFLLGEKITLMGGIGAFLIISGLLLSSKK